MVTLNEAAPNFSAQNEDGITTSLSDFAGKTIVLYFYPKDDTPGCTKEACSFTENMSAFNKIDAVILGVSKDSVASHKKFKEKYNLNFSLLSDIDGKICADYGTWIEKSMYGRKYMGIDRSTFIIDKNGIIRAIWRNVKVTGHTEDIIKFLQQKTA